MINHIRKINIRNILAQTNAYFSTNQRTLRWFWSVNFIFLLLFRFIENGFSNPLSIAWLLIYYVYWCGFFRVYYRKKPYFLTMDIFGSMVPSTKILFFTFTVALFLVLAPFLPLLMGFNNQYVQFFEAYMQTLQNIEANMINQIIFSVILILISPLIICRPFFAWISALQGLNGSMKKAFERTKGNFWNFVILMLWLNLPCVLIMEIDGYLGCQGWLYTAFYSIFFIYINLVFAKLYDFFYND